MNKDTRLKHHSLRLFLRNQLLLLTGLIVVGFSSLMIYHYIDARDIAARTGLLAIGSHYAKLHDEGKYDQTSLETERFSIFVGRENLPVWVSSVFPNKRFENYKLTKNVTQATDEQHKSGFNPIILLTAIPIENGGRQLFVAYHFLPDEQSNHPSQLNVLKTVITASALLLLMLLIAVFWIARRFNQIVVQPLEALTDMASHVDKITPNPSHPILHNQSEVGQVAQALKKGMERIHLFHQRETDFLQNASHELRTPITVVGTAVDIIERRQEMGNNDLKRPLQHIRQATKNMKQTTEALLWLSRDTQADNGTSIPSSITSVPLTAVDLQHMLNELVAELSHLNEEHNIEVNIHLNTHAPLVQDPSLVRIILNNLIRNAFEHTFSGHINIDVSDHGISITDTGIGLDKGINTTQRGRSGRGSFGLGLDIASRIAKKKGLDAVA